MYIPLIQHIGHKTSCLNYLVLLLCSQSTMNHSHHNNHFPDRNNTLKEKRGTSEQPRPQASSMTPAHLTPHRDSARLSLHISHLLFVWEEQIRTNCIFHARPISVELSFLAVVTQMQTRASHLCYKMILGRVRVKHNRCYISSHPFCHSFLTHLVCQNDYSFL